LLCSVTQSLFAQANFTAPAEVLVNDPITLTNTTAGGSTFFWNFCSGNVYTAPTVTNLGYITGMDVPVFIATAKQGNDYYAFFTNNNTPSPYLYRLYFGNSLLNTPTVTNLGSFGGVIPYNTEGVQVVEDADGWHVLVVGSPMPDSKIVKVDFGASLTNPTPVAVDWGNIGNLSYPHDLFITKENNQFYGFTINAYNNTITRFDFGTDFRNAPTGVNLGNPGGFLDYPDGIFAIQESGSWHVFVTNRTTNSLSRYDFGTSLVNTPTATNLGNPGGLLQAPRDLCVIQDCGKVFGLVVNETNDDLVRIDFQGNITSTVVATSLGSQGLDFPHSISTLFRVDNSLYAFIVNAHNNTLARVEFNSCTNASIPSSTQQQPPVFSYNAPGTYTVNLIADEGLPTQSAFCKTILVKTPPVVSVAGFTAPDTVCVNAPVNITNTTTGASTYLWNFCSGGIFNPPQVDNLGNPGGTMNVPVFMATAKEGNDYYGFFTNNTQSLVKLFFGNSLLNTPVATNMGNFGGELPLNTESLQIIQDADGWHILICGGANPSISKLIKLDFGASLSNPSPVLTNWGNIGNLNYPVDLFVTKQNNNWYGFTVNYYNSTVTRFDFGASFNNTPVATNLGGIGDLDYPTGIFAQEQNGNWFVFVTNEHSNTLTRMDFGPSLANTPAATNIGNPDNVLNGPRDLTLLHDCGNIYAVVVNHFDNSISRIDFRNGLSSQLPGDLSGVTLPTPSGGLSFPHSISTLFREGNSLYAFITNADNNTLSRLVFGNCNDASIPSSTQQQPPVITYSKPGTYTINLLADELLPSQSAFCKNIVVLDSPRVNLGADTVVCSGATITLDAGAGFRSYQWSNGATTQQIDVNQSGTYSVTVSNGGCSFSDDRAVNISQVMQLTPVATDIDCNNPTGSVTLNATGGSTPYSYYLGNTGPATNNVFSNLQAATYTARVQDRLGCEISQAVTVRVDPNRIIDMTASSVAPSCYDLSDGMISVQVLQGIPPFEYALKGQPFQPVNSFSNLPAGDYTVYTRNGVCIDSQQLRLTAPARIAMGITRIDELCSRANGRVALTLSGGTQPYDIYWNNNLSAVQSWNNLSAGNYMLRVDDARGCSVDTLLTLNNINLPPVRILNNDTTINIGERIQLIAVNAPDYVWAPATGLSCADCANPVAQPMEPTRYIVNTVTGLNCVPADTVTIYLSYDRSLFVPTAFSPNADGNNDLFRVKAKGVAVYAMQVYNRWGQLIFEAADLSRGWDGRFKSQEQPAGTYVYVVRYAYFGKETQLLEQKGTFTLIR
jgi:gliding motility-associated-like protein